MMKFPWQQRKTKASYIIILCVQLHIQLYNNINFHYAFFIAFIFNDCGKSSDLQSLPEEFREKYIMSKLLGRSVQNYIPLLIIRASDVNAEVPVEK